MLDHKFIGGRIKLEGIDLIGVVHIQSRLIGGSRHAHTVSKSEIDWREILKRLRLKAPEPRSHISKDSTAGLRGIYGCLTCPIDLEDTVARDGQTFITESH